MKFKTYILMPLAVLLLTACGGVQTNEGARESDRVAEATQTAQANLSQREIVDIVMACERVEHQYAMYRDRLDAEAFAGIFTSDGEWGRSNGRVIKGREDIAQYIVDAADAAESAPEYHMQSTTTVKITPIDRNTATGISYALLLEAPEPEDGERALVAAGFQVASESRSTYEIDEEGCKIATREYTTFFVDP